MRSSRGSSRICRRVREAKPRICYCRVIVGGLEFGGRLIDAPPDCGSRKTLCSRSFRFSPVLCRDRNAIERMFCSLKGFRRVATSYDRLAVNFLAAVCIATTVSYWLRVRSTKRKRVGILIACAAKEFGVNRSTKLRHFAVFTLRVVGIYVMQISVIFGGLFLVGAYTERGGDEERKWFALLMIGVWVFGILPFAAVLAWIYGAFFSKSLSASYKNAKTEGDLREFYDKLLELYPRRRVG